MAPLQHGFAEPSDAELVAALRKGDASAYATLIRVHGGRMLSVARRMLGHEEDSQDAVQQAFLSAFKAIDRFEGDAKLSTWLHRITVNSALMKLRQRRTRPELSIETLLPQFLSDGHQAAPASPWTETPSATLQRDEARRLVREAIEKLPENHRIVLLLRDIEELSTDETAQILGIEPNAAKVRLHRARQALRAVLDPYFREDSE